MARDPATYDDVSGKFDEWVEIKRTKPLVARPKRPARPYTPETARSSDMGKSAFAAIGIGIGILLLLLAGLAFATAARWGALDRDGAVVGYTLVGVFLLVAGFGGIGATYNHNFRVLAPGRPRSAAHH